MLATTDKPVIEVLADFVTAAHLRELFRVSEQTIALWRKHKGLPYVVVPGDKRGSIHFRLERVRRWAESRHVKMYVVKTKQNNVRRQSA